MKHETASALTLGGLAVVAIIVTIAGAKLVELNTNVAALAERSADHAKQKTTMAELTTTWTSALGEHSVTTTQNDGETAAAHAARHKAAVVAAQVEFPPV